MNAWLKSLLLLVILSVGFAFGGYMYYKNSYVKPRAAIAEERVKIEATIQNGKSLVFTSDYFNFGVLRILRILRLLRVL